MNGVWWCEDAVAASCGGEFGVYWWEYVTLSLQEYFGKKFSELISNVCDERVCLENFKKIKDRSDFANWIIIVIDDYW